MRIIVLSCLALFALTISVGCQNEEASTETGTNDSVTNTSLIANQQVEASCGQCQFELDGTGCDLAVRIDGKSYYVDGAELDGHGDAHADDGMCNCIRHAKVSGEVKDGRFVATSFELLPAEKSAAAEKTDHKEHDH